MPGLALDQGLHIAIRINYLAPFIHCGIVHPQMGWELIRAEIAGVDAVAAHVLQHGRELFTKPAFIGHKLGQRSLSEFGCWNHGAAKGLRE